MGKLWCPDCAAEGLEISLWEKGSAELSRVVGRGDHGDAVEVLDRNHDQSEERYYYLVRVDDTGAEGWVPETLIQLGDVDQSATIIEGRVVYHMVQEGETLAVIAERYGRTVGQIVELNHIADPNGIEVGQKLIVSPEGWTP